MLIIKSGQIFILLRDWIIIRFRHTNNRRQASASWPNQKILFWEKDRVYDRRSLRKNTFDHFTRNIGQPEIAALESICEPLVIDTQKVEDGGMKVVDVDTVLNYAVPKFARFAPCRTALDSTASHPS